MNIIYGICSWGLGHATRSLPIIRKLIADGNKVTIISAGTALDISRLELRFSKNVNFIKLPDYPPPISEAPLKVVIEMGLNSAKILKIIRYEYAFTQRLLNNAHYDLIISDNRYGICSRKIKSIFITHQLRVLNPLNLKTLELGFQIYNAFFSKLFQHIVVPDFKSDMNLAGKLAHNLRFIPEHTIHYIGPLSDFKKINTNQNIDCLILLSGPEPHRTNLEFKIAAQLHQLNAFKKVVITTGCNKRSVIKQSENISVCNILSKNELEHLLNSAKIVVARAGYSTIMDLCLLNKKALLIPTPAQPEQEYLAKYHYEKGNYMYTVQKDLNFKNDLMLAEKLSPAFPKWRAEKSVENFMHVIYGS